MLCLIFYLIKKMKKYILGHHLITHCHKKYNKRYIRDKKRNFVLFVYCSNTVKKLQYYNR